MRALISIFLIFMFAGGQAFAGICAKRCVHDEGSQEKHSQVDSHSSHSCCDTVDEEPTKEDQGHDCSIGHCMVSMPSVEVPLLTTKVETEKKFNSDLAAEIATQFRLASLSSKALSLDRSDPGILTPKVPLYIYYQKLLIP